MSGALRAMVVPAGRDTAVFRNAASSADWTLIGEEINLALCGGDGLPLLRVGEHDRGAHIDHGDPKRRGSDGRLRARVGARAKSSRR